MKIRVGRAAMAAILGMVLVVPTGCMKSGSRSPAASPGVKGNASGGESRIQSGDSAKILSDGAGVVPIAEQKGIRYVEANKLVSLLGMDAKWDPTAWMYEFGDKDATFGLKVGDSAASKDGDPVQLTEAPTLIGSNVYLPVSALGPLLQEEMTYQVQDGEVRILPNSAGVSEPLPSVNDDGAVASEFDFADDPADPFKDDPEIRSLNEQPAFAEDGLAEDLPAAARIKNINMPALIRKAYQYMGTPYIFGASSYARTGGFDCSLYTQYIYGKFGISLPRLARQQARVGVLVSRKSMRVGDLVFFYIPGRFKSNKTVGHVGIYLGNGKMINADNLPKKGVQITNINKPYWKRTFISARRVAY